MLAESIGVRCLGKTEQHVVDIVEAKAVAAWGEAHAIAETVHRFRPPPDGSVPALVLGGDADMFLPASAFDETAEFWRAEKHILKGGPHALMGDSRYWRSSAEIILEWLTRLQSSSSDR